jgi:hypothetical protein
VSAARASLAVAIVLVLTACGAAEAPRPLPSAPSVAGPSVPPSPLPTPTDYMAILCGSFLGYWAGWSPGQEISADMERSLVDLARRGSTYREDAEALLDGIAVLGATEDPEHRETFELLVELRYSVLVGGCFAET